MKFKPWIFLSALLIQNFSWSLTLTSSAFKNGTPIPLNYTCGGQNISPPLSWQNPPKNLKSYVLILEDPDSPTQTWDHWLVFNINPQLTQLESNAKLANNQVGQNSYGNSKYNGPCPPWGSQHRYYFKLYALNTVLNLKEGASKAALQQAMQTHILGTAELMGIYKR